MSQSNCRDRKFPLRSIPRVINQTNLFRRPAVDHIFDDLATRLPHWLRWAARRRLWVAIAWAVALFGLGQRYSHSRAEFANDPNPEAPAEFRRPTGGRGHLQVDFAGQWLMGRTVVTGHGHHLYDRTVHWQLVRNAFPRSDESPILRDRVFPSSTFPGSGVDDQTDHDAESLMSWLMGRDAEEWREVGIAVGSLTATANPWGVVANVPVANEFVTPRVVERVNEKAVGGALYPPILAVLYAPLGLLTPAHAYHVAQLLLIGSVALAGKGVSVLSRGRIGTPIAIMALLLAPGSRSGTDLAQNAALSTCALIWGWALIARGRPWSGGAVWGLLAFKPIWAVTFLLAPVLQRRAHASLAMAAVGALQILITLPLVGVSSWQDWLHIGRDASATYAVNKNWIELSRDVGGIVRRPMIDYAKPEAERASPKADRLAALALASVLIATAVVTVTCGGRRAVGPGAAFLLLGCYLGGYRFMYYDAMLASVAFAALFADRSWVDRPGDDPAWHVPRLVRSVPFVVLLVLMFCENVATGWELKGHISWKLFPNDKPRGLDWELGFRCAWDTLLLLGLWAWLGIRLVMGRFLPSQPA
jgi:arabinofuranan 3-O-arabinosyltransferase